MRFSTAIAASALVAVAAANKHNETVVYTTEVVTAYTTYCPAATTITHGTKTYTITSATTLTITDCPCTVTKPVYTSAAPSAGIPSYQNGTAPVPVGSQTAPVPVAPSQTKGSSPQTPIATGGAGRTANVASLAGLVGLAAFLF